VADPNTVRTKFFSSGLVRDMRIPPPRSWLDVRFNTGISTCLGNLIPVEFTVLEPALRWLYFPDSGSTYNSRPGTTSNVQKPNYDGNDPHNNNFDNNGGLHDQFGPQNSRPIGMERGFETENQTFSSNETARGSDKQMNFGHYSVLFLDPDCDFVEGSGIRWLRTNVPYERPDLSGDVVFPYMAPIFQTPTGATGSGKSGGLIHRCVFLVYRQRSYIDPYAVHNYIQEHPTTFYATDFARRFNLDPVPTAGNFFYASFNPTPTLMEEMQTNSNKNNRTSS